jgi:hypothetical protein
MKIVQLAPLTVIVSLEMTECIALYRACENQPDPHDLHRALGPAFLAAAFAAYSPDTDQDPATIADMWRMWAPVVFLGGDPKYGRMPVPQGYED